MLFFFSSYSVPHKPASRVFVSWHCRSSHPLHCFAKKEPQECERFRFVCQSNRRRKNGSIASEWNKLFARLWGRLAFKLAFSPLLQREMQNQCILASIFIVGVPHLTGRIVMPHTIATDFVEQVGGKTVLNLLGFIQMDKQIIFYGFAKFTSRTTRIRWAWLPLGCFVDDWRFNSQQFQLSSCNELVGGRSSEAEKLKDSTWGQ